MRIVYSESIAENKEESKLNLKKNRKWYSTAGNYDELIKLYRSGRSINIRDFKYSDTIIIDCDELTDTQVSKLNDANYIKKLTNDFNTKRIDVFNSASNKYNKKKIFLNIPYERKIVDNIDTAYRDFRIKFEMQTSLKTDSAMDSYTQITFGRKEIDYTPDSKNHSITSQPTKDKKSYDGKSYSKKEMIPVNQYEINHIHLKKTYRMPRLEWNCERYSVKDKKYIKNTIKEGYRHKLLGKIIKVVTFNALRENEYFNTDYTVKDVVSKIKGIITKQFIKPSSFIEEEIENIEKQCYKEFEFGKSKELHDYYVMCCKECQEKERYKYTPRTEALSTIYSKNKYLFDRCKNKSEAMNIANIITSGDLEESTKLLKYHSRNKKIDFRKNKNTYKEYINNCPKSNDYIIVDRNKMKNTSFRNYCKLNNLKITTSERILKIKSIRDNRLSQDAKHPITTVKNVKVCCQTITINSILNNNSTRNFDIFDGNKNFGKRNYNEIIKNDTKNTLKRRYNT